MRRQRKAKQIQTELLFDPRPDNGPIQLDLPADRQMELQRLVGELLLSVGRPNAEVPKGGECDK
jgi:hypothetical protein